MPFHMDNKLTHMGKWKQQESDIDMLFNYALAISYEFQLWVVGWPLAASFQAPARLYLASR